MRKRIFSLILGVILCCSVFAGCSLIEHNDEKDMRQVVAVIDPITDVDNGVTFKSDAKYIYKLDLRNAFLSYGSTYQQQYGMTAEEAADRLLDELITRELLIIEAERLLAQGHIEWTQKDTNDYNRYIYSAIDNQLKELREGLLTSFSETLPDPEEEETPSTKYPTPESETSDEDYSDYELDSKGQPQYVPKTEKDENGNEVTVKEQAKDSQGNLMFDGNGDPVMVDVMVPVYKKWERPEQKDWPCLWGDDDEKSRDRETIRRFVNRLQGDYIDDDFKVTDEDRKLFAEDDKKIKEAMDSGIENVYPMLGSTHYLQYLAGKSARQSILISKLQDYIVGEVKVGDEEIVDAYTSELRRQKETYADNQEAYQKAVTEGNTTLLYLRDDSYFYVKHILLPFSAEQTAAMNAYKADPKNAGKDYTIMRDGMVNSTVVYEHVNGEDDLSRKYTVKEVFDEIRREMAPLASDPKEAERKFDELTYKYNTDSGAFGQGKSYAVKRGDDTGYSGYMKEFYFGAMELYNNYRVGEVLPRYAITDYGVHIMYFSQRVIPGYERQLGDPLTPAAYKTVRETFEEKIRTAKESSRFTAWQNERITYYQEGANSVVHTYKNRYKSLYED